MLSVRTATIEDLDLYYEWLSDPLVRENSIHSDPVPYQSHSKWFQSKLQDKNFTFYIFQNEEKKPVGQVRFEKTNGISKISISISDLYRGKGIGNKILGLALKEYSLIHKGFIVAYIKSQNYASKSIFSKAGFKEDGYETINNCECIKMKLNNYESI